MRGYRRGLSGAVAGVLAPTLLAGLLVSCASNSASTGADAPPGTASRANVGLVESDDTPSTGGKLVFGLYAETNGWNPASNNWAPSGRQVASAIFDTLTAYDDSSQLQPNLAKSLTPNADYTVWTVELRPGIKLQNGKDVDAEVVVRNQEFLRKSPVVGHAYDYAGVVGFEATGPLTFTVTVSQPTAALPALFTSQVGVVADPDWLESNDSLKPIGTGPFTLNTWDIDKSLVAQRNQSYWRKDSRGNQLPYLDTVEFRIISDPTSQGQALLAKDIDIAESVSGEQIRRFQGEAGYQVFSDSKGESQERMVMLNTKVPPLDDPDVRKAIAYATDAPAFSEAITGGFEEVATGVFAPNSPWHTETDYPKHDLAKAKELVEAAKARHGGTISFTLRGTTSGTDQQAAQILQQQWAEAGIDVQIEMQEQAKAIINVVTGSYQATLWAQFDAPNPVADGLWWDQKGAIDPPAFSLNFARNTDPVIGQALTDALGSKNDTEMKAAMATVQKQLTTDLPYIWLTHRRVAIIASDRVVNIASYTLPDGAKGLDLTYGAISVAQIWLRR